MFEKDDLPFETRDRKDIPPRTEEEEAALQRLFKEMDEEWERIKDIDPDDFVDFDELGNLLPRTCNLVQVWPLT